MLTLAVALLVGRAGAALIHAAAVAPAGGRAVLVVGDARSGKTTTCTTLLRAGWGYLSDDQCLLSLDGHGRRDGLPCVEGLPRRFHLDRAWEHDEVTGERLAADPRDQWPNAWLSSATLGAVVFPRVAPDEATSARPVPAADAFARLVRQAPWFLADRAASNSIVDLLAAVAALPCVELVAGRDCYGKPAVLLERLAELTASL